MWLIQLAVQLLIVHGICGQWRGRNSRSKICTTSRDDIGKCMNPRQCWYDGEDLFDPDNICGYSNYRPMVCCPPNEIDVIGSRSSADASCKEFSNLGASSRARENNIFSSYGSVEKIAWKCGGSLISDQFVLTAGHCLRTNVGDVKVVRLGDLDLKSEEDNAQPQQFFVSESISHPDYKRGSHYHDVGLVKLDSPVRYTPFVRPACLQMSPTVEERKFIATGWGSIEFAGDNSDTLQKVDLDFFPDEKCMEVFGPDRQLKNGVNVTIQLCAGGYQVGKDTCQGDSGGPLQVKMPGRSNVYKIVGITSFGKGCGLEKVPGVYTRVSHYVPWIESVVWS